VPIRDTARRLSASIVSVMPADRAFFFLLLGSTFLFISSSLGWWHAWQTNILESSRIPGVRAGKDWIGLWREMLVFAPFPIGVAGAAGFFVSFFPGRAPLRRLHLWVYLPAAIGLALTSLLILAAALALHSTMNPWGYGELLSLSGISTLSWNAGPGLHFTFLGLVCVALSASRIRRGLAVLPIHLKSSSIEVGDISLFQHDQRNWMKFVWVAITLLYQGPIIAGALISLTIGFALDAVRVHFFAGHSYPVWLIESIPLMIVPAVFLLLVLLVVGRSWREVLRNSLRLPLPEYFGIALFLPVAIYSISQTFPRVLDRLDWTNSLRLHDSLFALFPLALVEEIAWRGYLQPRFIARFGLYRGIFFVGIVWAAFHFSGDFRSDQADTAVFRALVERILGAILVGFALSWLTLHSKSVLPAAVMHTVANRISNSAGSSRMAFYLALVLWAVADLLLFRFWPPRRIASGTSKPAL